MDKHQHMAPGRIAIFFPDGYLGASPSMINAARLLGESGYEVDIITQPDYEGVTWAPIPELGARVHVHICPSPKGAGTPLPMRAERSLITRLLEHTKNQCYLYLRKITAGKISRPVCKRILCRLRYLKFARSQTRSADYTCFIGVDMDGLAAAVHARRGRPIPIVYWSLEIRFLHELQEISDRIVKRMECKHGQHVALCIVQDDERARSLAAATGWESKKVILVPNGPLGPGAAVESRLLHDRLGLAPDARVVLHAGMICDEVRSLELAEAAASWPEPWVLVLHDRAQRDSNDPYLRAVKQAGRGRVVLSITPVPYDQLDMLIGSAYVGIVLYDVTCGPNFALMGGASGKAAHYFRCGLPVISVGVPSLARVLHRYNSGIDVPRLEDVVSALQRIAENYQFHRNRALACYEDAYEFGGHFKRVLEAIPQLKTQHKGHH